MGFHGVDWSVETIRETLLNYQLVVYDLRKGLKHELTMKLHDYLSIMDDNIYMAAHRYNTSRFRKLIAELPENKFLKNRHCFVWLGGTGTLTKWHSDLTNNMFVQLFGEKRVSLIPEWLLPLDDYPTKGETEIVIRANEMLYIPKNFAHSILSLSPSLTFTFTTFLQPDKPGRKNLIDPFKGL